MEVKEVIRKGVKILGIVSVAFVPGCKTADVSSEPTKVCTPKVRDIPPLKGTIGGFPPYTENCFPTSKEKGLVRLADGEYRSGVGMDSVIIYARETNTTTVYFPLYTGQILPDEYSGLWNCKIKK